MLFPILKALIPLFQLTSNKGCFSAKQQTKTVGLTNFVVNFFCFQTFLRSHSLDHYYNLLISREVNIPSWQMKVLQSCHLAHQLKIPYVMQHEISSPQSKFFCFFYSDHFTIEEFFEKLSLEPYMDVWIKVIDSTVHYNTENICKVHLCLTLVNVFFQYILTSDIHINCLVFWFTKAIICCTGKCSCISPVDVCYGQHFSFLHHTSISLVPRLLFGPGDVWFKSTQCFTG